MNRRYDRDRTAFILLLLIQIFALTCNKINLDRIYESFEYFKNLYYRLNDFEKNF